MRLTVARYIFKKIRPNPAVLVHGGAGNVPEYLHRDHQIGVMSAAKKGYETLIKNGSALDAVHHSVYALEENPLFNAGIGSELTYDGKVEMDASIMDGHNLNAGCVSLIKNISSPITLARMVMEKTCHNYLAGESAMSFAVEQGFQILPEGALDTPRALENLDQFRIKLERQVKKNENCESGENSESGANSECGENSENGENSVTPGTVGAVAVDIFGNVAAATSTGGLTGKSPGRIGDSSILGAGTYADNCIGAVSVTGLGEPIMRYNAASRILSLMAFKNYSPQEASEYIIQAMTKRFKYKAGVITVDNMGRLGIVFTSRHMAWAYHNNQCLQCGI